MPYFNLPIPKQFDSVASIKSFQSDYNLTPDGNAGPVTLRRFYNISHPRVCNVPDLPPLTLTLNEARRNPCKFNDPLNITYTFDESIYRLNLTQEEIHEAASNSFVRIQNVCNVRVNFSPSARDINPKSNITIGHRNIDGFSGVLAESESACQNYQTPRQWYDKEPYIISDQSTSTTNKLDFTRILLHELLHAFGINYHIKAESNGLPNIVQPFYNPNQWELGPGDIRELQNRFGPPISPPPPPQPQLERISRVLIELSPSKRRFYAENLKEVEE